MRILHINLAKRGIGRYGVLYGQALGQSPRVTARSVFDTALLEDAPILQEQAGTVDHVLLNWERARKDRALRRLFQIVQNFKPDLIHDSAGSYTRSLMIWPLLRTFAPLLVTEHDPVTHLGIGMTRGERWSRQMLDWATRHIFVHGDACRQALVDRGIDGGKISCIRHGHLGLLFDRKAYTDTPRRRQEVLFFGEIRPNKGADWLLEVGTRVQAQCPQARFVVAGSVKGIGERNPTWGDMMLDHLAQMRAHPAFDVQDRFIPDEEVELIFRRAGLALMPYREATQSGVAMVAMPLGSVIVATNVGGLPEVVHDGDTGYLAEPNPDAIVDRLVYALQHPEETARIRAQALHFALEDCSWERVVNTVVDIAMPG